MRGGSSRKALAVLLLALGAVLVNLHSPTIFFDNQVLLGSILGVFALLRYGSWGVPVGLAAALTTVALWGHPYQAITLIGLVIWQWFVVRIGRQGRVVLATMAYWLLLGLPLQLLLYTNLVNTTAGTAVALGLKEAVVSVITAALALLVDLSLRMGRAKLKERSLSIRHISFAGLLTAISLPSVLIILLMGQQLTNSQLQEEFNNLELRANDLLLHGLVPLTTPTGRATTSIEMRDGYDFQATDHQGRRVSSNPELFASLDSNFRDELIHTASGAELELLVRRRGDNRLAQVLGGYWCMHLIPANDEPHAVWREVKLVQPARNRIEHMQALMRAPLLLLALMLLAAALLAEVLAALLATPFERVIAALRQPAKERDTGTVLHPIPILASSRITELNNLVGALNTRAGVVNTLSERLLEKNRQLRLSEQRHRLLADNALDLIVLLSADGRPTYVSPSMTQLRGYSQAEALGMPLRRHVRRDGHHLVISALRRMRQAQAREEPLPYFRFELEQRHRNGSWVLTDVTANAITDDDGSTLGILVICRDLGDRLRAEARHREQLEQKLRASLTAAAAGHEISQPLATLQLANRLMRQALDNGSGADPEQLREELDELLQLQHEAGDAAMTTIDVMRRLLREPAQPSRILDLAALAAAVLRQTRSTEAAHGVVLLEQGLDQPCPIRGDHGQLEMALSNLLSNALQAVQLQPPERRRVRVSLQRLSCWVNLKVEDSGPGLPPDLLENLPLNSSRPGGTGLGLYLVRVMLENHAGRLRAASSALGGASLTLELPIDTSTVPPTRGGGDPAITVA